MLLELNWEGIGILFLDVVDKEGTTDFKLFDVTDAFFIAGVGEDGLISDV